MLALLDARGCVVPVKPPILAPLPARCRCYPECGCGCQAGGPCRCGPVRDLDTYLERLGRRGKS